MKNLFFKTFLFIILVLFLQSCLMHKKPDWRNKYFSQAKKRVTTIDKFYDYRDGKYIYKFEFKKAELFNDKDLLIAHDSSGFYDYDSLDRRIEEKHCLRKETYEYDVIDKYYYDDKGRLIRITNLWSRDYKEKTFRSFVYNNENLLVKETWGDEEPTTYSYYYNSKSQLICKIKDEYNSNVKKRIVYEDSIFNNNIGKIILNKHREIGKDLVRITKYTYLDTTLIAEEDTTVTPIEVYKNITPNTLHSGFFNKTEYKYASDGKLIEKIKFRPDYKTPCDKIVYEYITEWLK
jgi:hypothetical protein